ncbi:MAG: BatD family protein [Victivallales bacterium]|nr:BatD family protein [Victivallales bacterium]
MRRKVLGKCFPRTFCGVLLLGVWLLARPGLLPAVGQGDIRIEISPTKVLLGEPAELKLISTIGFLGIVDLPVIPGLNWASGEPMQSKRTTIINTKRLDTFETVYTFTVSKEGEFTIPELEIDAGHVVRKSAPLTFTAYKQKLVTADGKATDLEELLYVSAVLLSPREEIFIGEEVDLELRMYSLRGLPVSCSWPAVEVDKIVLRNYGRLNPDAPNFLPPVRRTVKLEEQIYNVDIFKTAFRAISTGVPNGKITIPCVIKLPREPGRRGGDPFDDIRDSFFASYRTIKHNLVADMPERRVVPLPPVPEGSIFLGLVGEWQMSVDISSSEMKAGAPETLKINLSGNGTVETLVAPPLNIKGMRIYPPEVKKSDPSADGRSEAEIRYAMIPKAEGMLDIDLSFCTFCPSEQAYRQTRFTEDFNVAEGDKVVSSMVLDTSDDSSRAEREAQDSRHKVRDSIMYLKRQEHGGVLLPIYRNRLFQIILLFAVGPLFFGAYELACFRLEKLRADPRLRRRNSAKKRKRGILDILEDTPTDQMHHLIQSDITPYLNDLLGYPPGTSAMELAEKVDDTELADCLRSGSMSSFMPHDAHEAPQELKKKLLDTLRRVSIFLLIGTGMALSTPVDAASAAFNNAIEAHDSGQFDKAEKLFKELLSPRTPDPALLYNIGNCLYQQGKKPEALVFYEKARRLNPSDSEIMENLNYIRRSLGLPEIGTSQNPIQSMVNLRDTFRPDSWLLFTALAWSLSWLALVARRFLSARKWVSTLVSCLIMLMTGSVAYITQINSTYSPNNAIVVKKDVNVYSLPTITSRKIEFDLRPGMEVSIEEERHDWARIRDVHSEGWVSSDSVEKLWPY